MDLRVFADPPEMGQAAAELAAQTLQFAIQAQGHATLVVATGASQFEVLSSLTKRRDVDWEKIDGFHLDEYIGIDDQHPASFRRYLRERFVEKVPLRSFEWIQGDSGDPVAECDRLGQLISKHSIDLAMVGIGENGHLAFNDPPADFDTTVPYLVVDLDEACRRQQFGEGWFDSMEAVPTQAISMSVRQILSSKSIICSVPDQRKAEAVQGAVEGPVSPQVPASILQQHQATTLLLDKAAASKLQGTGPH